MSQVYNVPGMSCGHCKDAIERSVSALDGVETSQVTVDLDAKTVTVTADVDTGAVTAAIDEAGYDVTGVLPG